MQRQYVGIDLHRRRSVIVRRSATGETIETVRIDNDPITLAAELAKAGPNPEVVLEAGYGWYWAADVLVANGATLHLAHPLGNNWGHRRVKNDERDASDLVDLLRLGRLAEAWVAPPQTRELRELVRYRAKLVGLRSGLKAQVHAVLAKQGIKVSMSDLFGVAGQALLDTCSLGRAYAIRVESLRDLIGVYDREITMLEAEISRLLADDAGYRAIQVIPGVGPVLGAVRSRDRRRLTLSVCRQAVLLGGTDASSPGIRHLGAPRPDHQTRQPSGALGSYRGHRSPAGWLVPPGQLSPHRPASSQQKHRQVAAARKLLRLVFYGLRDGEIRCLATQT